MMKGSCLCGGVTYSIEAPIKVFQYCHCSRCRKISGAAHAANIILDPKQFNWLRGEDLVGRFEPADSKYFATGFCKNCGSSLPWKAKGGRSVIVPAGTLDEEIEFKPQHNIFWGSRANWYTETNCMVKYENLPVKT